MNRLKSHLNFGDESSSFSLEITDKELRKNDLRSHFNRNFSRHKLPLESSSHRYYGKVNRNLFNIPKTCNLQRDRNSETAFSILQYQLKDRDARQIHIENLKRNLERRIQSAKAQGNERLVALLTKESREIALL